MSVFVFTPERLKQEIDKLVKEKGVKAFVLSSDLHGTLLLPSKTTPLFRIPCCIGEDVFRRMTLGEITKMSWYTHSVTDINQLSVEAIEAMRDVEG